MMRRRAFLQVAGILAAAWSLVRPVRMHLRNPGLSTDNAFEQMKRLRLDFMLAAGNSQRRYAINRQIVVLGFRMLEEGADRQRILAIGQRSLSAAKQDYAALTGRPYTGASLRA
jgi:hypothetical protein